MLSFGCSDCLLVSFACCLCLSICQNIILQFCRCVLCKRNAYVTAFSISSKFTGLCAPKNNNNNKTFSQWKLDRECWPDRQTFIWAPCLSPVQGIALTLWVTTTGILLYAHVANASLRFGLVFPIHTFRVLLNGWKITLDSKPTLLSVISGRKKKALFCNTLNVLFLCSYYLSLLVFTWYFVQYIPFFSFTLSHLSLVLSSPVKKKDGSCSLYPDDQLYLLSFLLSLFFLALFLLLACLLLCLLLTFVRSSLLFCLLFFDTYQTDQTKPLLCLQAFLPSFIPYRFLAALFLLSLSPMCWCL